jgi:hypothetical protein
MAKKMLHIKSTPRAAHLREMFKGKGLSNPNEKVVE